MSIAGAVAVAVAGRWSGVEWSGCEGQVESMIIDRPLVILPRLKSGKSGGRRWGGNGKREGE